MLLNTSLLLPLATLAVASASFAQNVHVVDGTGVSGSFVEIQPAIDAAAPGDLVLVKSGVYNGFTIDGKSIAVVEDRGATVSLDSSVTVQNAGLGSAVVLHGLRIPGPPYFSGSERLAIRDSDGHMLVQDLSSAGGVAKWYYLVSVERSRAVTFVDCDIANAGAGVSVHDSTVRLYGCIAVGALGQDGSLSSLAGTGAPALAVRAKSDALVVGCDLHGGRGGLGILGGDGGAAILVGLPDFFPPPMTTDPSDVVQYGNVLVGGNAGGQFGLTGPMVEIDSGTVESPAASARSLATEPTVRVGETLTLSFEGQPNDLLWLLVDVEPNATVPYLPVALGAIHPGPTPLVIKKLPDLDATGRRSIEFTLSPLGVPYVPTWHQAVMFSAADGFVLSNPRFVALLDGVP